MYHIVRFACKLKEEKEEIDMVDMVVGALTIQCAYDRIPANLSS